MTKPAAIQGSYADLKTIKSRSVVQVIIELPIERGEEVVRMFGFPQPGKEVPVALARLQPAPTIEHPPAKDRRAWEELPPSQQAAIRCDDQTFVMFLEQRGGPRAAEDPAEYVREHCGVKSRADIKPGSPAAKQWFGLDSDYQLWKRGAAA